MGRVWGELVKLECPTCKGRIISPNGQGGEKVCGETGWVLSKPPIAKVQRFTHWVPEWYSNWNESDSETLREWLTILRAVSSQLNLPSYPYREEAARRIRKESQFLFQSNNLSKNKRATVAALLHLVLRLYEKNRSIKEICEHLNLDSRLVTKQFWAINKNIIYNKQQFVDLPRKSSRDYLFECGTKITSCAKLLTEADKILMQIRGTGGNPIALAAGALYYICKKNKITSSKEQIGEAFKISHRTVYSNEARIRRLLYRSSSKGKTFFPKMASHW